MSFATLDTPMAVPRFVLTRAGGIMTMASSKREIMMELKELDAHHVSLTLSRHELGTMGNALNEVCNGIRVEDFETKMGAELDEVHQTLRDIIPIYRRMKSSGSPHALVALSIRDLRAIIGALKEVCSEIDAIEFATRMGAQRSEVDQILNEIVPIYHQVKLL